MNLNKKAIQILHEFMFFFEIFYEVLKFSQEFFYEIFYNLFLYIIGFCFGYYVFGPGVEFLLRIVLENNIVPNEYVLMIKTI